MKHLDKLKLLLTRLQKVILPYFPDSKFLRKYWWHKLLLGLCFTLSASSLYSIIFYAIFLALGYSIPHIYDSVNTGFGLVLYDLLSAPNTISGYMLLGLNLRGISLFLGVNDFVAAMLLLLSMLTLIWITPSLIYRLIIFVVFGERWKNK